MSQRLERIKRLLRVKEQQRDIARGHLAEARQVAVAAATATARAEATWDAGAVDASAPAPRSVTDFAAEREHLATLQREVERARERQQAAEREEEARHAEACDAQVELRQIEIWSESEHDRHRVEGERKERIRLDELAAQRTERGKR